MNVSILGQDMLARATHECCARHFNVVNFPCSNADVVWFCHDTPIGAGGEPDVGWVLDRIRENMIDLGPKPLVLISSQVPVGTTQQLQMEFPENSWAYSPENLRVATAVADFEDQARVIVGRRDVMHDNVLHHLFAPFTKQVILTDVATAEMCKHALNAWLGMNIAFINEVARLCAVVKADPKAVSQALLSERRVSSNAPLRPGAPFGGGHLSRDIWVLNLIADTEGVFAPLIRSILESNRA